MWPLIASSKSFRVGQSGGAVNTASLRVFAIAPNAADRLSTVGSGVAVSPIDVGEGNSCKGLWLSEDYEHAAESKAANTTTATRIHSAIILP